MQDMRQQRPQNPANIKLPYEHGGESSISSYLQLEFSVRDDVLLLIGKLRRVLAHDLICLYLAPSLKGVLTRAQSRD